MKVNIKTSEKINPSHLEIHCYKKTSRIMSIKQYAESIHELINVDFDKYEEQVEIGNIFYFESIDKKTFAYLKETMGSVDLKLYELEEQLAHLGFLRISKSTIVNLRHIKKVTPMLNRNLLLTLYNDEKLVISRRKVPDFKKTIKMEG